MNIIIDNNFRWHYQTTESSEFWYIGNKKTVMSLVTICEKESNASVAAVKKALSEVKGNYSIILKQKGRVIAAVDRIRSYPIFYFHTNNQLMISNSARLLKNENRLTEIDELSFLEFIMAGYVTGCRTLYRSLNQLQAGEFLLWNEEKSEFNLERYYLFYSAKNREANEEDLIEELDAITNRIFSEIIEEASGNPIWVPLSGGLDSRLALSKFKQLGYDNLRAFSYGPAGNYEAKAAKYVSNILKVPWVFLESNRKNAIKFFNSRVRREHWDFADGLCSIPFYQDIQTLWENEAKRVIPQDAVIVNGNSGDFISGGHVPKLDNLSDHIPVDFLLNNIINKHYSLWSNLKSKENITKISNNILNMLHLEPQRDMTPADFAKYWELWEWQERQSKFVVNGQRNYDFYGFKWSLPLWYDDYLFFWSTIPIKMKIGQNLYKKYLQRKNFYNVFKDSPIKIWRWPGITIAIVPFARAIKLFFGKRASDSIYKILSYWGHYRDSYAYNSYLYYLKHCFSIRNPNSLFVDRWIKEEGLISLWDNQSKNGSKNFM